MAPGLPPQAPPLSRTKGTRAHSKYAVQTTVPRVRSNSTYHMHYILHQRRLGEATHKLGCSGPTTGIIHYTTRKSSQQRSRGVCCVCLEKGAHAITQQQWLRFAVSVFSHHRSLEVNVCRAIPTHRPRGVVVRAREDVLPVSCPTPIRSMPRSSSSVCLERWGYPLSPDRTFLGPRSRQDCRFSC